MTDTVSNLYRMDSIKMHDLLEAGNEYWQKAASFYFDIENKDYKDLSLVQKEWLDKIEASFEAAWEFYCV